jgi:hypothetical protein
MLKDNAGQKSSSRTSTENKSGAKGRRGSHFLEARLGMKAAVVFFPRRPELGDQPNDSSPTLKSPTAITHDSSALPVFSSV